jgi:hypothetical protein
MMRTKKSTKMIRIFTEMTMRRKRRKNRIRFYWKWSQLLIAIRIYVR